jgi:hypothetical protein
MAHLYWKIWENSTFIDLIDDDDDVGYYWLASHHEDQSRTRIVE